MCQRGHDRLLTFEHKVAKCVPSSLVLHSFGANLGKVKCLTFLVDEKHETWKTADMTAVPLLSQSLLIVLNCVLLQKTHISFICCKCSQKLCDVINNDFMDQRRGLYAVGKIRKPVKVWLVLLWLVTMLLYLVACSETVSPASSSRTAEPEVTRKPSDESHSVIWLSLPFTSFRHT